MAETTLTGAAIVWGSDYTSTGVIVSATTGLVQDTNFTRSADIEDMRNEDGTTVGKAFSNLSRSFTVTVVPADMSGDAVATARTNADNMIPELGTVVTVVDVSSEVVDGANSGKYLLDGARLNYTNNGAAVVEFDITQFDANDVTTNVS